MASTKAASIRFAGSKLSQHRHVCAFFNTPEEEYRTMLPFMFEGLTHGDRVFHTTNSWVRDDCLARLRAKGVDVDQAQSSGQLALKLPQETYMRGGRFNTEAMLALVQEVLEGSADLGFAMTRLSAHVDWVVSGWSSTDDWLEYEARLNHLLPRYSDPVICTYDSNSLGAGMALDVVRTHPMVVIGGLLQENPFFVSPDEFLEELNQRRRRSSTSASRASH
jgi:hypothetical protein